MLTIYNTLVKVPLGISQTVNKTVINIRTIRKPPNKPSPRVPISGIGNSIILKKHNALPKHRKEKITF